MRSIDCCCFLSCLILCWNRQATWEEEWMDNNPGMVAATNHERKVRVQQHLFGDMLCWNVVVLRLPFLVLW